MRMGENWTAAWSINYWIGKFPIKELKLLLLLLFSFYKRKKKIYIKKIGS